LQPEQEPKVALAVRRRHGIAMGPRHDDQARAPGADDVVIAHLREQAGAARATKVKL